MKPLNRKLLRDLFQARALLVAIVLVISVGVMCFVTLRSSYENLSAAQSRYYRQCRMADFWIDLKKVPKSELERLERFEAIGDVDSRIQFSVTVDLPDEPEPINGLIISLPDVRRAMINDIVVRQGEYFTGHRSNEVIVSDSFARERGIRPGDSLRLLLNNRSENLIVVGTAISSEYSYMLGPGALLPDPKSFGVFYLTTSFAEEVYDFSGAANQIVGRLGPGKQTRLSSLMLTLERELEPFGVAAVIPRAEQTSHSFLDSEIDGLRSFATVIPTIFLAVASLILNVLISRLVRRQRTMIGTMKALGYDNTVLFLHFLKLGSVVGGVGGLLGCALGYGFSRAMTEVYRGYFEFPDLRSDLHWGTFGISLSASVLSALLGSLFGAKQAVALQPAEAMRPEPPRQGGAILLEKLPWFWMLLDPGWRLTMRGVWRTPVRSLMTVFSTMMGAGLLLTGFNLLAAQEFLLDFQFFRVNRSELELVFQDPLGQESLDDVRQLPGVDRVEPVFELPCTLTVGHRDKRIAVQGIRPDAQLTVPRDVRGDRIGIPATGLVLDRRLAENLGVRVGDSLRLTPSIGARREVEVRVATVVDSFIGLNAYADLGFLSRIAEEIDVVTRVQLTTDGNREREEARALELKEMPEVIAVVDRRDLIQSLQESLFQNQMVMIVAIVIFSAVIFLGSIINATMIGLAERSREVATLRAIGYVPWGIGGLFLRESLLTSMLGTLLGLPTGLALVWLLSNAFATDLVRLPVAYSPLGMVITFVLAIFFVGLAHLVVQRSIHRMQLLEMLNIKE